ncbi:MAG: type II secretion system secretin GspD [Rhizomicrobium sp.]
MAVEFRRRSVAAVVLTGALCLAACADQYAKPPETVPSAAELARHANDPAPPAPPQAAPAAAAAPPAPDDATPPEIIKGTGDLVGHRVPHAAEAATTDEGGITLNFINADVRDVAKAVFGDFLNVNYTIGAGVQGTITVQTSKPLSRAEVLPVFEQILRMNGLAIVKNNGVYKLVLNADAPREVASPASSGTADGGAEAGYGTQIVPLHYIAAGEMQRLLDGMAPAQAIVHADSGRNLLIVQGTAQERQAVAEEVALFDVDWLAGMSFGLFTPKYTDARGLAKELSQILGGAGGPLGGIVKLIPIERLNTVLVISPQPRYLDQVQHWVARLDRPGVGSDRRIFVYAVQNGRASDLAATLKKVLYGGSGGTKDSGNGESGDNGETADHPPAPSPSGGSFAPSPPPAAPPPSGGGLITESDSAGTPQGAATITADENNNAVVIYGTPQEYATIEAALRQLDAAPLQVLLEAAIAEVTLTDKLSYGVQYAFSDSHNQIVLSNSGSAAIGSSFPGFSYAFAGSNIKVVLNTLSQLTHVEVLSSPQIMVLNNHQAQLQVGDQVPIATSQGQAIVGNNSPVINTIEYRATGIILKVTPRVNQGGMVTMDISQEVSDVASTDTSSLDSPTITQRKIDSTIAVHDNETVALGGLIKDTRSRGSSGLPYLSEIPVLGGLFGTKSHEHDRTELIVLITPHVVDNLQKSRAVTEELRHKLPGLQTLLERK